LRLTATEIAQRFRTELEEPAEGATESTEAWKRLAEASLEARERAAEGVDPGPTVEEVFAANARTGE
jgi:hypothetical protein